MARLLSLRVLLPIAIGMALALWSPALAGDAPAKPEDAEAGEEGENAGGYLDIHPMEREYKSFSDTARGGYGLYEGNCAGCHGRLGEDHDHKSALRKIGYVKDYRRRRKFHEQFAAQHGGRDAPAGQVGGALGFNQIEMIAKYLRELDTWLINDAKSKAESG